MTAFLGSNPKRDYLQFAVITKNGILSVIVEDHLGELSDIITIGREMDGQIYRPYVTSRDKYDRYNTYR